MRDLTGQAAVIEAMNDRSTHVRVSIDRTGSGGWVDLSDYQGLDWVEGIEYGDDGSVPVGEATVLLRREWELLSLSPMMAQSKLNASGTLVWAKREIKIEIAIVPTESSPVSGDWIEVFRGRIDEIDWRSSPMSLKCRDLGGDLQDGWVETQKVYGSTGGTAVETVMQSVLDDAYAGGWIPYAVTLYSVSGSSGTPFEAADSPGFAVKNYKQGREPIMDVLQKLARLFGWECRYRWNANDSAFRLTLYEPARPVRARGTLTLTGLPANNETFVVDTVTYTAKTSGASTDEFNIGATATATATAIADMINAGTGADSANAWAVGATVVVEWQAQGVVGNSIVFTESMSNATVDGSGTLGATKSGAASPVLHTFSPSGYFDVEALTISVADVRNFFSGTFQNSDNERVTLTRINSASIAKYHRRPFLLTEGANSQIDTVAEMADMLEAADSDLSEPDLGHGLLVPYFPWGESGDYYTFEANGVHYDTDQSLAAASLRHTVNAGVGRTVITASGKPSLGVPRWLEAEGRPGVAPSPDIFADDAASGVSISAGLGTIIVQYDDPATMDPAIDDWAYTNCHVSTSSGFTPGVSTLAAVGRQTRFEINGLVPGTTYYCKLQIVDNAGNVATTTMQVTTATQRVGPYHENLDGQRDQLIRNPDFNITTNGITNDPDFWTTVSDDPTVIASGGVTGSNILRIISDTVGARNDTLETEYIPMGGGASAPDIVQAGVIAKITAGTINLRLQLRWYTNAKAFISSDTTDLTLSSSFEAHQTAAILAPSTAAYFKMRLSAASASVATFNIDRAVVVRGYALGSAITSSALSFGTAYKDLEWDPGDIGPEDIAVSHITIGTPTYTYNAMEIELPGIYLVHGSAWSQAAAAHVLHCKIDLDEGGVGTWTTVGEAAVNSDEVDDAKIGVVSEPLRLNRGDRLRLRAYTSIGAAAGRNLYLEDFFVRQLVRIDQ